MHLEAVANALLWALLLGGAWYSCQKYWRHQAMQCAAQWASAQGLELIRTGREAFRMHRQHPQITFKVVDQAQQVFHCTLRLTAPFLSLHWHVDRLVKKVSVQEAHSLSKGRELV